MHEISENQDIWKLVWWIKEKSHLSSELLIMLRLRKMWSNEEIWKTVTAEKKADLLKAQFFLKKADVNLSDIEKYQYSQSVKQSSQITSEMMRNVMNKWLLYNMSDADDIFNVFLRAMSKSFEQTVTMLTQTCWNTAHYSMKFCRMCIVSLQKLKKKNYIILKIW